MEREIDEEEIKSQQAEKKIGVPFFNIYLT